jgi:hypothetical protein
LARAQGSAAQEQSLARAAGRVNFEGFLLHKRRGTKLRPEAEELAVYTKAFENSLFRIFERDAFPVHYRH